MIRVLIFKDIIKCEIILKSSLINNIQQNVCNIFYLWSNNYTLTGARAFIIHLTFIAFSVSKPIIPIKLIIKKVILEFEFIL